MSNLELARLLRSAASALEHGRFATARKKLLNVIQAKGVGGNIDPKGILAPVVANAKPVSRVIS